MTTESETPYTFGSLERFAFGQRIVIRVLGVVFYLLVRLIGATIRFETRGIERFDEVAAAGKIPIYCFWHDRIVSGTYYFRGRGIIVLSSSSFDSEYTARCIQRFGFGIIKGSSTRGGVQALVNMIRMMKQGYAMAFTSDGPKGPRYVAKAGPVLLAKKTGNPLIPFVFECMRFRTIKSWDRLQIPLPFTRAAVIVGEPIYVDAKANDAEIEAKQIEFQASLDNLVAAGERWRLNGGQFSD
ncbi:MAG: lysophospholipid acyltransferase family protein [Acidobacteriota bacterium]|nr:MAG: lysophospholipid acyltransferase family protein [Acidobacteriota bacterium]